MQRMVILTLAILITLLVALQLGLPPLLEREAAKRLTKHGGTARVDLSAFPSLRLLRMEGRRLEVRAEGLVTPPADPAIRGDATSKGSFSDLDGFDEVDIQVVGMHVGPLTIARLILMRDDADSPYTARIQATTTAAAVATFAGSQIGGGLGGFLGGLAGGTMPGAGVEIPIDLEAILASDDGAVRTRSVNGSVGGLPAGPFVETITAALAGRL
jgi:hypothetical protein